MAPIALLSVSDKTGLVPFAKELEGAFLPSPNKIKDLVSEVVNYK